MEIGNKIISDKFSMMSFGRLETGTPKVDEIFGKNEWIDFGLKNDYPQELIRLYQNSSGRHSKLIQRKVDIIAGNGFREVPELTDFIKNQFSKEDLNEIAYKIAFDEVIFGGFYINVIWNKAGDKIAQLEHIPFEKVRIAKPNEEGEVEGFFISKDWTKRHRVENKPEWISTFNPEKSKEYPSQLLQIRIYSPGMEFYSLPSYQSSLNWIKLDYEISTFHLKNVQNGLMPGMIVVNKMGIPPAEEREKIYNEIKARYSAAENAGDFIMVFAENDKAPEFIPVELNASDQRFKDLKEQINEELMIAHGFTQATSGIAVQGALGSRQELEEQLEYLQTTVITPLQNVIDRTFNKLAAVNNLPMQFKLNNYKFFNSKPSEVDVESVENKKIIEAINLLTKKKKK